MAAKKLLPRSQGKSNSKRENQRKAVMKAVARKITMPIVKDALTKGGIVKALMDMTALPKKRNCRGFRWYQVH